MKILRDQNRNYNHRYLVIHRLGKLQRMRSYHDIQTLRAGRTVARSEGVRAVDA